ncbi:hypothetical protein [Hyphomonas jannaschiana]|uniref:hypothetical protein n=1 Tax=Hyphomonas jannaschiana TaxID=86 RepID=UPI0035C772C6
MRIELRSIVGKGDLQKERVTLRVTQDANIGEFVLFQADFNGDEVTTEVRETVWFQDKPVNKGDLIVIYTRDGAESEKILTTGKTAHFYYLGKTSTIWDRRRVGAVILHAPWWQARQVADLE